MATKSKGIVLVPVKLAEYVATALRAYDRKPKRRKENAND